MDHPPGTLAARAGQAAAWLGSAAVMLAATAAAMDREITTLGGHWTGRDFWNNTWRAVRGLLSGINIYGPAHVSAPGIGHGWPVAPHVPGSLLWQAPFALLPLRAAVITYAFVSIAAIWAGVLVLCRPRQPWAVFTAAAAGGFAIYAGGGPMTLVLGQPTGFALLGLALVVRARRPWLAGLGFMLAATTIQTGLPLGIALLLLGGWPTVWRGATLLLTTSIPPLGLEVANAGLHTAVSSLLSSALFQDRALAARVDLGSLLFRLGVRSGVALIGAGLLLTALTLVFVARLPARLRRIGYPPALSLVIAITLVGTYHEAYDMLLIGGAVAPVILVHDRSRAMLPAFALAGLGAAVSGYYYFGYVAATIALLGIAFFSSLAAWRAAAAGTGAPGQESSGPGGDSGGLAPAAPRQDGMMPC